MIVVSSPSGVRTDIFPLESLAFGKCEQYDYRAICVYAAIGFFLDDDTFWTGLKVAKPASQYSVSESGDIVQKSYWNWYYEPRNVSLDEAVEEFGFLLEAIIGDQVGGRNVILPISGGLDSRTLAIALHRLGLKTQAYSYEFDGGPPETAYGEKIARVFGFPFRAWTVRAGYLWEDIETLASINQCYAEFTHARQFAFIKEYRQLGDVFCLGHGGDLLFDSMRIPEKLSLDTQVAIALKKIVRRGGRELGEMLWNHWGLSGSFQSYLEERVRHLVEGIRIDTSANARLRAFKSMYWVPRWTNTNLRIFEAARPVALPYYDRRMCDFICTLPEHLLDGRKIQIEYIKRRSKEAAKVTWQARRPFNLYNYEWNRMPYNLPVRMWYKMKNGLARRPLIQRNWELQFLGPQNDEHLRRWLFDNKNFVQFISPEVTQYFYRKFTAENPSGYAHAISMLLTLSLFAKQAEANQNGILLGLKSEGSDGT